MHIELTDHLRCPHDHEEAFLILLPERMDGRRVAAGMLACPICDWKTSWSNGIPEFGNGWDSRAEFPLPADAIPSMLSIEGAGGWLALGGSAAQLASELTGLLPGIGIVAVNPPTDVAASAAVQVIRGSAWPIKSHALRGAVLGPDASQWRNLALASLLPGRHLIGVGASPGDEASELLGSTGDIWVVRKRAA
jgi:hypothetical protein